MDLEQKLNGLIEKYNLKTSFSFKRDTESEMLKIWRNIPQDKKIAIWGAGDHGNELIKFLPVKEKNIICFIDKSMGGIGEEIAHYPIYRPDMIEKLEIDLIIISSYRYRKEIAEEIKVNYKCDYIDYYQKLEDQGIILKTPFYYNHPNYMELYEIRNLYENDQTEGKERHLWNLICKYLAIRDFKYAINYIKEYISLGFSKKKELQGFLKELKILFTDIKNRLSKRNKEDITLFLIDSIRNRDVLDEKCNKTSFLYRLAKKSATFKNAFSTNLFTYMSLFSMFTGKLPIDGNLYTKDIISIEESDFLRSLQEREYKLYSYVLGKKLFYDSNNLTQIKTRRRVSDKNLDESSIGVFISNVLWRHLCDLYKNEGRPVFSLLHLVGEIHKPHICGYHEKRPVIHRGIEEYGLSLPDQNKVDFFKQYYECVSYVDKQLEYYINFLPENMTKVFFGDHGQVVEDIFNKKNNYFSLFGCPDSRIHVPLIINSPNVINGLYSNLFSMKNLGALLLSIINGDELKIEEINNTSYIEVQFEPIFNKALADSLIDISSKKYVYGFKAIRDDKKKYVLYNTGEEDLYILPNEDENCLKYNECYSELQRVKSFMKLKEFPSFNEEKFNNTINRV